MIGLHCNSIILAKDFTILSSRIPPDFPWPKFDQPINRSSRIPLSTITNRASPTHSKTNSSIIKTENQISTMNSNQFHSTHDFNITSNNYPDRLQVTIHENESTDILPNHSSDDLENLFYYNPSSPLKQFPMLSSCANHSSSSQHYQSDEQLLLFHSQSSKSLFTYSSPSHLSRLSEEPNEDLFLVKYHENIIVSPSNISNTSSPSKYRILNTPERV